jgi:hypothetical protein
MAVKVMERLSNQKWRELLGRYIFGLQETGCSYCIYTSANHDPALSVGRQIWIISYAYTYASRGGGNRRGVN